MSPLKLVKMANEIAIFFESAPDDSGPHAQIAAHLARFWEPRLRRALLAWVDDRGGDGLRPSVLAAIAGHRAQLTPAAEAPRGSP